MDGEVIEEAYIGDWGAPEALAAADDDPMPRSFGEPGEAPSEDWLSPELIFDVRLDGLEYVSRERLAPSTPSASSSESTCPHTAEFDALELDSTVYSEWEATKDDVLIIMTGTSLRTEGSADRLTTVALNMLSECTAEEDDIVEIFSRDIDGVGPSTVLALRDDPESAPGWFVQLSRENVHAALVMVFPPTGVEPRHEALFDEVAKLMADALANAELEQEVLPDLLG